MTNIKETLDVLDFIEALGIAIARELEDGPQIWDVVRLFEDESFREKLAAAIDGISLVPTEAKNIDLSEGFMLSRRALEVADNILQSFDKAA